MASFLDALRQGFTNLASQANTVAQSQSGGAYNPSAYTVSTSLAASNPDQASADLVNKQTAYFNARGKPLETAAITDINDAAMPRKVADQAGSTARAAFDATNGMEGRALSRFGIRLSGDKARSVNRNFGLERALVDAGAQNTAYGATQDAQLSLAGDALQIGRGIAGQATQGLSTAGSLATGRIQAAKQAGTAERAGKVNSMFSGAGLGAALGGAGALGASIGAVGGAGLGAGIGLLAAFL